MASISFKNVVKTYENGVTVIPDLNLEIEDKEFIVLVGPSGCGKSTTLRMIAGLESVSDGELWIGDTVVNEVPPKDRDIAMVFQSYALYPHMTVYKNMAFALELAKVPKDEIDAKVREAAKILELEEYLDRKPKALSGGPRQRVALGRAMVRQPAVFLLDEPLSNLDAKLRTEMRSQISALHKRLATTFVYVTHDQTEAMTMGDRICVMKKGIIQQFDTPEVLYNSPCNMFVAGFIGSPQMNFIN
ncbi:MAG: ATP-binding cassette domain-containing protein, partial [Eubacterium sp.]|nr:ATP-binding cassette domain-containing protein [Candidatus Colimonas fimequi]